MAHGVSNALATVATIESQVLAPRAHSSPRLSPFKFRASLATVLTPLALIIQGYHPYAEDGGLYLAGVEHALNPSLYPSQTAFVLEPTRLSLFAPTIAALTHLAHAPLPLVLLALYLATLWATFYAAALLAEHCWPQRTAQAGAVALLACWLGLPVAGTALLLMDPYLTARSFSTPCTLFALAAVLHLTNCAQRVQARHLFHCLTFCTACLLVAALMHPLMAADALLATLLLLCVRSPSRVIRAWGVFSFCAAALAIATSLQSFAAREDPAYLRIALTRTYWFPSEWRWYELAGLATPLLILAALAFHPSNRKPASDAASALARMAIAAGLIAYTIAALFARTPSPVLLVARMQPLRLFQIVYLVLILFLGAQLGRHVLRLSAWRWAAALILLGGSLFAASRATYPNSNHLELPGITPRNPWSQAFLWVRGHAPTKALFALAPDYINAPGEDAQCFRAIAERSALPDYSKDGGEASIAPDLASAWQIGQTAQQVLSSPATSDPARIAALRPLGVSWIVLPANASTHLNCPFANSAARVCRLP